MQFLVFRLGEDEYGLPIDAIDEVTRLPEKITRVPKTPKFLEGVVNLRGEVLPVIDQRRRFDLPAIEDGTRRRIVVVRTKQHRAGVIVDSVTDILTSSSDAIDPAPDLTGEATRLVSGILNLEAAGRIVLLLDPAELLTRAERGLLDSFAAKTETDRSVIRLLVVDDSALVRKLLGAVFAQEDGFELRFARDGFEALELNRTFTPDVVTLDLNMPRMDGLACLDRLMIERPCPVVMVSSYTAADTETTLEAFRLGAVDFVPKPTGAVSLHIGEWAPQLVVKVRGAAAPR